MATKLFLRDTSNHGITGTGDAVLLDMVIAAGASVQNPVTSTTAGGTEIQWGLPGTTIAWISDEIATGFTLTSTDISIWAVENNMSANCGGRYRVFKRTSAGVITELGGGPFDDGVEFGTAAAEMTWVGNVTDTAFAAGDRILLRIYVTNVGVMATGFTCTLSYNAADGTTGDSFFNLAETVAFKGAIPEAFISTQSRGQQDFLFGRRMAIGY